VPRPRLPRNAQTFTKLADFDGTDGSYPLYMAPVQGVDGSLYGTTMEGGASDLGTVFKVSSQGGLTSLYSFSNQTDGYYPIGVVQATDGKLYGTTQAGGTHGGGTVYEITLQGVKTTVYNFCTQVNCTDGQYPVAALVEGTDGTLYGTTEFGGINGDGTVFKLKPGGVRTTLYSFCSQADCTDGNRPVAGLAQGADGNFYGTTYYGGGGNGENCFDGEAMGCGTVFKITPAGALTTLYSFCARTNCTDGSYPHDGLVQAIGGDFYGTTLCGGNTNSTDCYAGLGTVFEITPSGTLTTLHTFVGAPTDGALPYAGLVQATDGSFYGTTDLGGTLDLGTLFVITATGESTLHSFSDGEYPSGALIQATDGNFYGTTSGGRYPGTFFRLSMGLGPFVSFARDFGRIGETGPILGQGFTGTTSVSLNGTQASFTVVSDTYIKATVPAGATTGYVTVTTPSGTLTSNVPFHVIK
jgi:uncharacterized repeat protein (TIGR03803 family)